MNEATYTVSANDLAAANKLHFIRSFSVRRWFIAFLVSLAMPALLFLAIDGHLDPNGFLFVLGFIWAFIIAICIVGWLMIPRQSRRNWSQAQKMWTGQRVTWDADKIHFKSERGEVNVPWSNYYQWAADERSLLLYQDSRTFYLVPLRDLPTGARETMAEYLKAAGVKER